MNNNNKQTANDKKTAVLNLLAGSLDKLKTALKNSALNFTDTSKGSTILPSNKHFS